MTNADDLKKLFADLPEDKRNIAFDTVDEYVYFSQQIEALKKYPKIAVNPRNPYVQKITPAGKLIKEYSQVIDAKRSTLLRIAYKEGATAEDELTELLKKYE